MFREAAAIDLDVFRAKDGARTFAAAWLFMQALGLETGVAEAIGKTLDDRGAKTELTHAGGKQPVTQRPQLCRGRSRPIVVVSNSTPLPAPRRFAHRAITAAAASTDRAI
jgi:hypothetical protein